MSITSISATQFFEIITDNAIFKGDVLLQLKDGSFQKRRFPFLAGLLRAGDKNELKIKRS